MFEPIEGPRLFALPPGVDFPAALIAGLEDRMKGASPESWARVEIFVNTRRMQRRIREVFDAGPPRLLPRIRLVTELANTLALGHVPPPVPALRRRLELTQLIAALLEREPDIAPRTSLFDLADSLAGLMDEMQGEGVAPDALKALDVTDSSGYWQRSLAFLTLIQPYFDADTAPDTEARQRRVADHIAETWQANPPQNPILVAGSTGSRGATSVFMQTVARLPQGAVILPGFDFDMPGRVWRGLDDALQAEDHPQYRFARLCTALGCDIDTVRPWNDAPPPNPARNRLISLALRPAPVTDQWMTEGKRLSDLTAATEGMTVIEAPSQRLEAGAIALILRKAAELGTNAALITPDRVLTRQVTAALDRWGIVPDDSAGRPLPLSAPGRFLRQVAALFSTKLTAEALLALLKHPLTHSGTDRGTHLIHTRDLELHIRRFGPPFPTPKSLRAWAEEHSAERVAWADWLATHLQGLESAADAPLVVHVSRHLALSEALACGPDTDGSGALWEKEAGREAWRRTHELRAEAESGGVLSPGDYATLFRAVLQRGEVRDAATPHPHIMIWGTLEARVRGADLVILGGLNEGSWPEAAGADPWLNRQMRHDAGLLLPERRIGLAAHDFQQAVAAKQVVLTRSIRDAEAQTVPSRWLNRLTNLLGGVSQEGSETLAAMKARGQRWLDLAEALDSPTEPLPPAPRPSPQPPVAARPKRLSITEIQTLIRDPYAIYAKHVLGLRPLDPIRHQPDAPLRGTVIHRVLERVMKAGLPHDPNAARDLLMQTADAVLAAEAPWPAMRLLWRAKLERVADWFIAGEVKRATTYRPIAFEQRGEMRFDDLEMTLHGKIDRIDTATDGKLAIIDYKTGTPPSRDQLLYFDKQLFLTAMMAEAGAIEGLPASEVAEVAHIGLGATPRFQPIPLEKGQIAKVRAEFRSLIAAYLDRAQGYTARRAMEKVGYGGDYDQLARYGEWDVTLDATPIKVGP